MGKFTDGFMIHSGYPIQEYIDMAVRHVYLRQGVLGIKVKIMLPWDPTGRLDLRNHYRITFQLLNQKTKHQLVLHHQNKKVENQKLYHPLLHLYCESCEMLLMSPCLIVIQYHRDE